MGVEGPIFCFGIWAEEVDMWVLVVVVVVHGVNHRKTKSVRKKTGNTQRKLHEINQKPPLYECPRRILNFPLSPIY